ncbi:hypothetical protein F5Y10DRAFT_294542 [Nemania abortiva]|nr:hypothetical protein F5Y10DRAFT_294542 [Nemania abortiva]
MQRALIFTLYMMATFIAGSLALTTRPIGDIRTSFLIDKSCGDNRTVILKAHDDARKMVAEILDIQHDELSILLKYTIDWNGLAVIEYFGSPNENQPYREHILRTLVLASEAYPGWGWSDYWNNRYVTITCGDPKNECGTGPAYYINDESLKFPYINYCPTFFSILRSHDAMWADVRNGPAEKKQNVRNLRSQATTALHELLHIKSRYTSNACAGGCKDSKQTLGGGTEEVRTYKAGRAKLLARRNVMNASMTNDNYAYYVIARWMEKRTNLYPQYPIAWDPSKSRRENEDREKDQPGAPTTQDAAWDIEDLDADDSSDTEVTNDKLYRAEDYPDWYRPIFDALISGNITSSVSLPPPTNSPAPLDANPDIVICEATDGSPLFEDCSHAFSFNDFRDLPAYHGKKDEDHWVAYIETCAINVRYHGDWTDACKAIVGDILDHAMSILRKCTNGQLGEAGRCGGHVPFIVSDCPGDVQIIHTDVEG